MRIISILLAAIFFFQIACSSSSGSKTRNETSSTSLQAQGQLEKYENFGEKGACGYDESYWAADGSGFTNSEYEPSTRSPRYLETPVSPDGGCSANYFIRAGTDELIPFRLYKNIKFSEIYVEFYIYFKSGFKYPGGLKIARFGNNEQIGPFLFLEYNYSNGDPVVVFYTYDKLTDVEFFTGNIAYTFPEDKWIKIGIYHKESTPNSPDGQSILYIDDQEVSNSGLDITRSTGLEKDFFWIGGNHSWGAQTGEGSKPFSPGDSNLLYDGIRIYNMKP